MIKNFNISFNIDKEAKKGGKIMAQLSSEERIRRVEMAPLEIQNRVAK